MLNKKTICIGIIIICAILLFSPIDLLPDIIPIVGQSDELLYIAGAVLAAIMGFKPAQATAYDTADTYDTDEAYEV